MSKVPYTEEFYDWQRSDSGISAKHILSVLREYVDFKSAIDIGCGVGEWLKVCSQMGATKILGVDGAYVNQSQLAIPKESFLPR